jgi:purine-nucleoside/S-methyl-5'-thioadenosine phosphorylase / adenosine deaminase
VFYKDPQSFYRCSALDGLTWLEHGFGTRHAPDLTTDARIVMVRQVHSDVCVAAHGRTGLIGEGDAVLENVPGHLAGVKTADCLPILLVDEEHRAVAAVHAGWRGTVLGIVRAAVGKMREEFGTRPARIHAAIGPGIGKCCFEVGPEVAAQFGVTGRAKIDLAETNRRLLLDAGVPVAQIHAAGLCTMCGVADFHSYRRDKERAGRMLSVVGVR